MIHTHCTLLIIGKTNIHVNTLCFLYIYRINSLFSVERIAEVPPNLTAFGPPPRHLRDGRRRKEDVLAAAAASRVRVVHRPRREQPEATTGAGGTTELASGAAAVTAGTARTGAKSV